MFAILDEMKEKLGYYKNLFNAANISSNNNEIDKYNKKIKDIREMMKEHKSGIIRTMDNLDIILRNKETTI